VADALFGSRSLCVEEEVGSEKLRMVRCGHLHFALGIKLIGIGTVLYFFANLWEQDCYRHFGPVYQEIFSGKSQVLGYCVLCGAER
jgi:hypothetical protein